MVFVQGRRGRVWALLRRGRAFPTDCSMGKGPVARCHGSFGSPLPETEGAEVGEETSPAEPLAVGGGGRILSLTVLLALFVENPWQKDTGLGRRELSPPTRREVTRA